MNDFSQMIEFVLRTLQRKSIEGYEVYLKQSSHFDVESKDGRVETFQTSHAFGLAIRTLNRQQMGFSYTTFPSPVQSTRRGLPGGVEKIIEDAITGAEATSADPCFDFAPVLKEPLLHPPIFDETLEGVSEKEKIEKAKHLEEAALSVDPRRINKVRKASYREVISRKTLINSNGLHFSYDSTLASISVIAVAEEGGESEVGWDFDAGYFIHDLNVEKVGRAAGRKALERLGGKRISSGVYPVLLRNSVAAEFLSLLAHSLLADQVQKGKSPLKGKTGEQFFSPLLSIVDDGLHATGISSAPIDAEGMPSQRTPLVIQGRVSNYLYDRYWANRENAFSGGQAISTGNSRRASIKVAPGIGVSNLFIEPGKFLCSNFMRDLHQGLIVEEVMGVHTVDPISGDFSLGCSGDWIDGGEKAFPVKTIAIAGNLFQLFQKVIGVGEDLRFFGGVGSPSLLIERLEVSGN